MTYQRCQEHKWDGWSCIFEASWGIHYHSITPEKLLNYLQGVIYPQDGNQCPRGSEEHFCDAESGITAARWHDNGIVTMASSEYGVSPVVKAECYVASQKKPMNVLMPNAIHQYIRKMGGVDRLDQRIAQYRPSMRGKKWYFQSSLTWLKYV